MDNKELMKRIDKKLNDCDGDDLLRIYSLFLLVTSISLLSLVKCIIEHELTWYIGVIFSGLIIVLAFLEVIIFKNLKGRIINRP